MPEERPVEVEANGLWLTDSCTFQRLGTKVDYSLVFFAVAVPVVLFMGIDKAGFASGASAAAAPALALILDPGVAVAIMLPLLLVADVASLPAYWRKWDRRAAWLLILGSLPGILLGALLVARADPNVFRFLIGTVALGFVAWKFARNRGWVPSSRPMRDGFGIFWGMGAGFTSFVAHAGGPMAAVYLLSRGLTKLEYQATTIIVFFVNNVIKLGFYIGLGLISGPTLVADLILFPCAAIGALIGVRLHRVVPEQIYFALIYVFLTITGTKLIFDALSSAV